MRVAIVGSRDYPDARQVIRHVLDLPPDTVVVSGGARGVDHWAEMTAHMIGLTCRIHYPDLGRCRSIPYVEACMERNTKIVNDADRVVAYWHEESAGTEDTIRKARRAKKEVLVIRSDEEL